MRSCGGLATLQALLQSYEEEYHSPLALWHLNRPAVSIIRAVLNGGLDILPRNYHREIEQKLLVVGGSAAATYDGPMLECPVPALRLCRCTFARVGAQLAVVLVLLVGHLPVASAQVVWPSDIDVVRSGLQAANATERVRASERLSRLPGGVSAELILTALRDPELEVRMNAAAAAAERRIPGTGLLVVPWLAEPSSEIRLAALGVLKTDPVSESASALARALSDTVVEVRLGAVIALGRQKSTVAARLLMGHLDDQDTKVRGRVFRVLADLGDTASVLPLVAKTDDPDPSIRTEVVRALGRLGDARALAALIAALKDRDETVRLAALWALGRVRDLRAIPLLAGLVQAFPRALEQEAGLRALATIGGSESAAAVMGVFSSTQPEAALESAKRALVRIGTVTVPLLRQCLLSSAVSAVSDRCLGVWSEIDAVGAMAAASDVATSGVASRPAIVLALGASRNVASLPAVLAGLVDEDSSVRAQARNACALILGSNPGQTRAVDPIWEALEQYRTDEAILLQHINLLGLTGAERASQRLLPFLTAGNPVAVRLAAIRALGNFEPGAYGRALMRLFDDQDPRVVGETALALRRAGGAELLPLLYERLRLAVGPQKQVLLLALLGPLRQSADPALRERALAEMLASEGAERDSWLEALGGLRSRALVKRLAELVAAGRFNAADRRKLVDTLADVATALPLIRRLATDPNSSVRAAAVWVLGGLGESTDLAILGVATRDRDVMVVVSAAAAISRLSRRTGNIGQSALCSLLAHPHPYVRMNALLGLPREASPCSELVRAQESLTACSDSDPESGVLQSCVPQSGARLESGGEPLTVQIIPVGSGKPEPEAPFAVNFSNGLVRAGIADRKGAVFEAQAVPGQVSLLVPAHLAW